MNDDLIRRDLSKESDMEIINKKYVLTSRYKVFAVAQFAVYMGLFAVYYWLYPNEMSNPQWRLFLVLALAAGVLCSVMPWLVGPEETLSYAGVIFPLVMFALFGAGYSFYTWSVPGARDWLATLSLIYLVVAPIGSLLVLFVSL